MNCSKCEVWFAVHIVTQKEWIVPYIVAHERSRYNVTQVKGWLA